MLARNVEQPAGILEKEVMMVTDVGVEIGCAGSGATRDISVVMRPFHASGMLLRECLSFCFQNATFRLP